MRINWSNEAIRDLRRLRQFLVGVSPRASQQVFEALRHAPKRLLVHPRLGSRLEDIGDRDVRRLIMGDYELRYEIGDSGIVVLRIWHAREDR